MIEKAAEALMKPINPSVIMILGIFTIFWGLWLVSPLWTVFTQAAAYSQMASLAPESIWGTVAVVAGSLVVRGSLKPSYANLRIGSWTGTIHWLIISIMYFVGDWTSTAGITTLCFATYAFFVWLNVKVNKQMYQKHTD